MKLEQLEKIVKDELDAFIDGTSNAFKDVHDNPSYEIMNLTKGIDFHEGFQLALKCCIATIQGSKNIPYEVSEEIVNEYPELTSSIIKLGE